MSDLPGEMRDGKVVSQLATAMFVWGFLKMDPLFGLLFKGEPKGHRCCFRAPLF